MGPCLITRFHRRAVPSAVVQERKRLKPLPQFLVRPTFSRFELRRLRRPPRLEKQNTMWSTSRRLRQRRGGGPDPPRCPLLLARCPRACRHRRCSDLYQVPWSYRWCHRWFRCCRRWFRSYRRWIHTEVVCRPHTVPALALRRFRVPRRRPVFRPGRNTGRTTGTCPTGNWPSPELLRTLK